MGATGAYIPKPGTKAARAIRREPIKGNINEWENSLRRGDIELDREHAALYDKDGKPIVGFQGDRHSVAIGKEINNPDGVTMTHYHPDKSFGGTLSMQDIRVFATTPIREIRAVSGQGQLYSLKAGPNVDRAGLAKWVQSNQKLAQKNFNNSYKSALKQATTPLKSGPHKGQIKLTNRVTGKVTYREPMTKQQAINYARTYSVGMFDRMYGKALSRYGVTYTATKAGRNSEKRK